MYTFDNINKKKKITITGYSKEKDDVLSEYAEKLDLEQLWMLNAPVEGERFKLTPKEGVEFINFIKEAPFASFIECGLDSISCFVNRRGESVNHLTTLVNIDLLRGYLDSINEDKELSKKYKHIANKLGNNIRYWTAQEINITGILNKDCNILKGMFKTVFDVSTGKLISLNSISLVDFYS